MIGVLYTGVSQLLGVSHCEFSDEGGKADKKCLALAGGHPREHPVVIGAPGLSQARGGLLPRVSETEPEVTAIAGIALAGEQVLSLQGRAEPADPALVDAQPVRHLLLGDVTNSPQLDKQGAQVTNQFWYACPKAAT